MALCEVRPARETDIPFIMKSWLGNFIDSPQVKSVPKEIYYEGQRAVIERILSRQGTQVTIAHAPGEDDVILGFLVQEASTMHFCFVKRAFRGFGIARTLAQAAKLPPVITFTHWTYLMGSIMRIHPGQFIYNPYLV